MWPFGPRRVELVVKHEIVGLTRLAEAMEAMAAAHKYEARVRGGFVRPKLPKSQTDPPEWVKWEQSHGANHDENEVLHIRWCYDVLTGVERVPEEKRVEAMRYYAAAQDAGYDLPDLDGRELVSRNGRHRSNP